MKRALAIALVAFAAPAYAQPALERAQEIARSDAWLSRILAHTRATPAGPIAFRTSPRSSALATLEVERPDAPGVSEFWATTPDAIEQLCLIEGENSGELHWTLALRPDLTRVARERDGSVLFSRDDGEALFRVPAAYAIDAQGRRASVPMTWRTIPSGDHLVVELEFSLALKTLGRPALVDPGLEAVVWQEITGGTLPAPRSEYGFVFDPQLGKSVAFAGSGDTTTLSDMWSYDGTWNPITETGAPARYSGAMSLVEGPHGYLYLGGRDQNFTLTGDTWRFDGTNWTSLGSIGPSKREHHAMVFAPQLGAKKANRVVLFGGDSPTGFLDETWEFSLNTWSLASPPNNPGVRFSQTMAYDAAHARVLEFGGNFGTGTFEADLWSYDGTDWKPFGDGPMPPRTAAAGAFDSDRNILVIFGGEDASTYMHDTWEWDSTLSVWSERILQTHPSGRSSAGMVYDPVRKRVVLFGGFENVTLGDTWEYRTASGSCTTSLECEGLPCVDGACCAAASCGPCEACSKQNGACQPILNAQDPDSCSGQNICDGSGQCKKKAGTSCSAGSECADGFCADGVCCNSPCQGACEACDLQASPGTCTLVSGAAHHGTCPGAPPCGSACSGTSPTCSYTPKDTPCGSTCTDATLLSQSCDGKGVCSAAAPTPCPNDFACLDGASCRTSCSDDTQCQSDHVCRNGACIPPATSCADDNNQLDQDGGTHSCAPYTCASGACLHNCTFAAQCAKGLVCDQNRHCVSLSAVTSSSDDSSGCGCRTPARNSGQIGLFWLFGALAIAARRFRAARTKN